MASLLEQLQSMNETRKRQVLITATVVIMLAIIGIWVAYLNSIVMEPSQQPAQVSLNSGTLAQSASAGPNLWQRIGSWFASLGQVFSQPSQYNIQPQH